ncbi:MAG: peroxidase family protein, partial [Luteimonas sp.]
MASFIKSDLEFILAQIKISEAHAHGADLRSLLPNVQVPFGMRTIDGSFNNLVMDQSLFGAADTVFPRLTDPIFRTADPVPAGFPGAGTPTSYAQTSGFVFDAQPRIISNLLVDQTANNPSAVAAAAQTPGSSLVTSPGLDGVFGTADDKLVNFIPNVTPDAGLSAPFNQWMTFFGQFFDHGLDLVTKGGSGTVFIPLQPDDPLFSTAPGAPNFMVLTRATNLPGPDGMLGTADDIHEQSNTTSPFVDQNQTYTSHPSHQVFLRAYEFRDSDPGPAVHLAPVATGSLIVNRNLGADGKFGTGDDTPIGGMATWAVVKAQARDILGINLTDADFDNVPLLATDPYGNFIKGPNGFPQVVMKGADGLAGTADDVLVEGNPLAPIDLTNAVRTGHQFLIDVAHNAVPVSSTGAALLPDADSVAGGPVAAGFYDNELLDAHYIAGDGRVNENIGLTTVHSIFHSEHNRLVEQTKSTLLSDAAQLLAGGATQAAAVAFLNEWLLVDVASVPAPGAALQWDGERLFQAAKFGTEMQYQHLVFEEFARTIQPNIDAFLAPAGHDTTIDSAIVAEFAHTVYRFGHSMLLETVDRFDPNFNLVNGDANQIGLIAAFLNPLAFAASGPTPEQATGAIVRGLTRQVGNEIDEFVTEALRNNLLGLPLDLTTINLARGRDTGIPSLNAARRTFYDMTQDSQLKPYTSWADLVQNLKHPESLINFIAAYGTHSTITSATTLAAKRAAAMDIVFGGATAPADRLDFLNSTGEWANSSATHPKDLDGVTTTGLGTIDFWIGGLAEEKMPFGGMLGSTFNFVFETQLEALQDGDRFYYLSRTAGLNFGTELENNSFSQLVMLNSDATHLPAAIFSTPTWTLEVDPTKQHTGLGVDGRADPTGGIMINGVEVTPLVIRDNPATVGPDTNYLQYTGEDHIVLGGTAGNDILIGGDGDDTLWGDAGDDYLEGGYGNDEIFGGDGDDIIQDMGGDDVIHGGAGNDVIQAGNSTIAGFNLILAGPGQDFIITNEDISEIFGGTGNDFILGAKVNGPATGNEGDDWIEMGTQDGAPGDNFSPLGLDDVIGNDIFLGGGGFDEFIGEGGDDIFVGSDAQDKMDGNSGFDWVTYKNDRFGVTADLFLPALAAGHGISAGVFQPVAPSANSILDRFAEVEGLSGSAFNDVLHGDNADAALLAGVTATGNVLTNIDLISGLRAFLGAAGFGPDGLPNTADDRFGSGNIILGGSGSDVIEGRGGDDLIDGDKWLNVRISVRQNVDGTGPEIASFDSMVPMIPLMLNRTYNPGQLVAVREILDGASGFDTANFSGHLADYTIAVNGIVVDPHLPLNIGANDIVTVTDSVAGRDGTDRLTHMERLQFAPDPAALTAADSTGVVVLVTGVNIEPVGQLAILDAATSTPDTTPTSGQLLRVSIAGVTDGDNVSGANPTGLIDGPNSIFWQVETAAGSGIFKDIVVLPRGALAFQSADGANFRVTPDLAGLALRVRAVYEDDHGVLEQVYSAPTAAVAAGPVVPPTVVTPLPDGSNVSSAGVHYIQSDLQFILDQIVVAERNAAGESLLSLLPNVRTPFGLRTVDGSLNNLVQGQSSFGAADTVFPRLTTPVFRDADVTPAGFPGAGTPTSYAQTSGNVFDAQPRTISNLLVDQTANNPSAYANAVDPGLNGVLDFGIPFGTPGNDDVLKDGVQIVKSPGLDGVFGTGDDKDVFFFPNVTPDAGLSAPFNQWMTFFGQFFDHGLDLVTKGGNGTVFIPLQPDDPLFSTAPGAPNFMVLTRATNLPGPDGILGTDDDIHEQSNTTSPFVDQNQTYTSHPSHQVFLRAYEFNAAGDPVATGKLIVNRDLGADGHFGGTGANADTPIGGMATWAVVKAQARDLLGINLTDADFDNVPLLRTDAYGNFIKGPNGFPQVITGLGPDGIPNTADDVVIEGNPLAPISLATAVRTGHQFLIDIAHAAVPVFTAGGGADGIPRTADDLNPAAYDSALLNAHYIAGDGRVNENIGLTAVHSIFHSEHNRLVDHTKAVVLATTATGDVSFLNQWLLTPVTAVPADPSTLDWNGERLFQAAKFGTEMQYQHLVFEEFARTIQPMVDPFFAPTQVYDVEIDAAIVAEFAHTVYRFGHSMLLETVDRFDPNFNVVGNDPSQPDQQIGLIAAFLNPLAFAASGPTPEQATGAIVRGITRQVGNEIDEFVTEALRNNLLGLPLDLTTINLTRGRDTGIPSLNAARREFYTATGDSNLKPYTSWADLVQHLKHPESLINFIAAYGTHDTITSATTLAGKRAAATAIVFGGPGEPADRLDFLNSTGAWANNAGRPTDLDGVTTTGLGTIDLWIGGLAEEKMPFGGMLGSTFNFVFENQLEKLQDGDRFYYLDRTAGLNFNTELENNSFAKLIMANTDATHLPALVFTTPTWTLEVDPTKQFNANVTLPGPDGMLGTFDDIAAPRSDPVGGILLTSLVIRDNPATPGPDTNYLQYTGEDHVVLGGTAGDDIIIGGDGDDTIWGDGGNDRLEGGYGNDNIRGGDGHDIITDKGGDDNIQGGDGNDVIQGGNGINLILGGFGQDFIITGEDSSEAFGGPGNDFILGSKANEQDIGNEGDDWIEAGTSDGAPGDNFDPFGNDPIAGNDVFIGRGENDKFNAEGGDDIMIGSAGLGDRYIGGSGYDWADFKNDAMGVTIDLANRFFDQPPVPGSGASALARFDIVEGLSGSAHADVLQGDNSTAATLAVAGRQGSVLTNVALINGMQGFLNSMLGTPLAPTVTFFDGGNILLGGAGGDILEGRGGDDLIDGDLWLNVRISVRAGFDPVTGLPTGGEIYTADSMTDPTLMHNMLNGVWNPGQLQIVRELLSAPGPDFDTAVYTGNLADYTVAVNDNGTPTDFSDDIITVTDNVAARDGTDHLAHIERLQFADQSVVLSGLNAAPVGALMLSDFTPAVGQVLTVSGANVSDANNTATDGVITGGMSYFWQVERATGTGIFTDITAFAAGELSRAEGTSFTVTPDLDGLALRVKGVYKDA